MVVAIVVVSVAILFVGCNDGTVEPPNLSRPIVGSNIPDIVRTALEEGQEFELYSLDPKHRDEQAPTEFLRRKIIGKLPIKDEVTRKRIVEAFEEGVQNRPELAISCFNPRHAIRVQDAGKTYYLSICFECENVYVFVDDQEKYSFYFRTAASPEPVFDKILKDAGVPLAQKGGLQE
jgi:hypothetical protein